MKDKISTIPINQEEIATYLKDIRKIKVMTVERERELAQKILSGNSASGFLIKSNNVSPSSFRGAS